MEGCQFSSTSVSAEITNFDQSTVKDICSPVVDYDGIDRAIV